MAWVILFVILLVVFGAKRVPELGASIGKGMRELKRGINDIGDEVEVPPAHNVPQPPPMSRRADDDTRAEPKRLL